MNKEEFVRKSAEYFAKQQTTMLETILKVIDDSQDLSLDSEIDRGQLKIKILDAALEAVR